MSVFTTVVAVDCCHVLSGASGVDECHAVICECDVIAQEVSWLPAWVTLPVYQQVVGSCDCSWVVVYPVQVAVFCFTHKSFVLGLVGPSNSAVARYCSLADSLICAFLPPSMVTQSSPCSSAIETASCLEEPSVSPQYYTTSTLLLNMPRYSCAVMCLPC
jgi:hypothetical protein